MGDREKAADRERGCNRDVENRRSGRALAVVALALAVLAAAVFALIVGPEPAQASLFGIPCR